MTDKNNKIITTSLMISLLSAGCNYSLIPVKPVMTQTEEGQMISKWEIFYKN
ncbi:MAG TPA: hypothetical protein PL110_08485 [Candidatus Eremiobacteraeota bacterium]|nr:MAG: hypothetical protein BWY64_00303 [bacterium ADurb.Bin363]HPZ08137.1 hypothetical protein [Candidatus Eremiobacteraeota bacterium]